MKLKERGNRGTEEDTCAAGDGTGGGGPSLHWADLKETGSKPNG